MASGVTLDLIAFSRTARWRRCEFRPTVRDRSLAGKARIRARRALNRGGTA